MHEQLLINFLWIVTSDRFVVTLIECGVERNQLSTDCVNASNVNICKNKIDRYLIRAGYKKWKIVDKILLCPLSVLSLSLWVAILLNLQCGIFLHKNQCDFKITHSRGSIKQHVTFCLAYIRSWLRWQFPLCSLRPEVSSFPV